MNFRTIVELPTGLPPVSHHERLMLMGSCFAGNIGERLTQAKFRVDVNPFGTLYNPLSVAKAIGETLDGKVYGAADLFAHQGLWHSPMHHGCFSAATPEEALRGINLRLRQATEELPMLDWLMLTFGTAYVYEGKASGEVVSNCHKLPEREFCRRLLSVEEIVENCVPLIEKLIRRAPGVRILCTVSPIRHLRDGLHANQLSKATLLLAIERLRAAYPSRLFYFPAYEIVLDELRDYRFTADDMAHPSPVAVGYLWQRFGDTFFTPATRRLLAEIEEVEKALAHKPFHPEGEAYQRFLEQIVLKIERLIEKYPYLDLQKEKQVCHTRLNLSQST
ncbi:MAG: GSCFA domain-containing protein [Mediterranea sp.]|nr:GSCFA domain-containing protein [Mediterranea sp.]